MSASRVVDTATDIVHQLAATGGVRRALSAWLGEHVSVKDFGAVGDGTTDDTAAINAAIAALQSTGGTIHFPAASYRVNGQILLPNNGAVPPAQATIRLIGDGPTMNPVSGAIGFISGTMLDLRYAGPGVAKIDTRGAGFFELAYLTLKSGGTDTVPIIQTTNTSCAIHHCYFLGSKQGVACDQDAIVLGGTTDVISGGNQSPFQGYGTVIRDNFFDKIRRCVHGQVFCNGVQIVDNTIWANCGTNLAGGAAIELEGITNQFCFGNYIAGNLIEVVNYVYGIKLTWALQNSIVFNSFYDANVMCLAYIRMDTSADYNLVIVGAGTETNATLSEVSATNTLINPHQNQQSFFRQLTRFDNQLVVKSGFGPYIEDTSGNRWFPRFNGTNAYDLIYVPSGGSNEAVMQVARLSATSYRLTLNSTVTNVIRSFGTLQVNSAAGQQLLLGDATVQHTILNGDFDVRRHLNRQSVSDLSGTVQLNSGATTAAVTFQTAYNSAPAVVLTPRTDPGSRFWAVTSTTGFTVTMQTAPGANVVFAWQAIGNPN